MLRSPQRPSTLPDMLSDYNRLLSAAPAAPFQQCPDMVSASLECPTVRFPLPLSRFPPLFGEAHPQVAPEKGTHFLRTPLAAEDLYYGGVLCL